MLSARRREQRTCRAAIILRVNSQPTWVPFDAEHYERRSREGPCFVCSILAGHPDYSHHDVYEDADTIAFLARWPTLLGHCLVAPKRHVESWVHDLDESEFIAFQRIVRRWPRRWPRRCQRSGCTR